MTRYILPLLHLLNCVVGQHATLPRSPPRESYDNGYGGLEIGKYATLPKASDRSKQSYIPTESVIEQSSEVDRSSTPLATDYTPAVASGGGGVSPSLPSNQSLLQKWSQSLDNIKDAVVKFTVPTRDEQ